LEGEGGESIEAVIAAWRTENPVAPRFVLDPHHDYLPRLTDQATGETFRALTPERIEQAASSANLMWRDRYAESDIYLYLSMVDQAYRDTRGLPPRDNADEVRAFNEQFERDQARMASRATRRRPTASQPVAPDPTPPPAPDPAVAPPAIAPVPEPADPDVALVAQIRSLYDERAAVEEQLQLADLKVGTITGFTRTVEQLHATMAAAQAPYVQQMQLLYGAKAREAMARMAALTEQNGVTAAAEAVLQKPATLAPLFGANADGLLTPAQQREHRASAARMVQHYEVYHRAATHYHATLHDACAKIGLSQIPDSPGAFDAACRARLRELAVTRAQLRARFGPAGSFSGGRFAEIYTRISPEGRAALDAEMPRLASILGSARTSRTLVDGPDTGRTR
jgi:hypothetical protein